jgi:hypothetical protein
VLYARTGPDVLQRGTWPCLTFPQLAGFRSGAQLESESTGFIQPQANSTWASIVAHPMARSCRHLLLPNTPRKHDIYGDSHACRKTGEGNLGADARRKVLGHLTTYAGSGAGAAKLNENSFGWCDRQRPWNRIRDDSVSGASLASTS